MNVLLATSWGPQFCGIQEHSKNLIAAVTQADPGIEIMPNAEVLDPEQMYGPDGVFRWYGKPNRPQLIHLNYHRALHSRWTPEVVEHWVKRGWKIVITFHDTFGENPPDQLSQDLCALADAFIVHEPCQGLEKAIYWRMGVPEYDGGQGYRTRERHRRLILGTAGFDFPWKNYTEVAKLTAAIGWGYTICCPEMSDERFSELFALNPWIDVRQGLSEVDVVRTLHECDATAFMYVCANSGQSAAILLGIAARKPVYALSTCRQNRALWDDHVGFSSIRWVDTFTALRNSLMADHFPRLDPRIVRLAEQDSWANLGRKYAQLYRSLA